MAFIDYGALLRINGKFINKNQDMFMDLIYETAIDGYRNRYTINGDYFVGAGDKNFYLVFYKTGFHIISNGVIIHTCWNNPFNAETFYFDNFPNVKIEHIDKTTRLEYFKPMNDYDKQYYLHRFRKKKGQLKINRRCKLVRKICYSYKSDRYLATWKYNGNKYEVIFGRGIDCNEECYNKIKYKDYGYTDIERKLIDSWFKGE